MWIFGRRNQYATAYIFKNSSLRLFSILAAFHFVQSEVWLLAFYSVNSRRQTNYFQDELRRVPKKGGQWQKFFLVEVLTYWTNSRSIKVNFGIIPSHFPRRPDILVYVKIIEIKLGLLWEDVLHGNVPQNKIFRLFILILFNSVGVSHTVLEIEF